MDLNHLYSQAIILSKKGEFHKSIKTFRNIIAVVPSGEIFVEVSLRIAQIEFSLNNNHSALILIERNLRALPNHMNSKIALGACLRRIGHIERAIKIQNSMMSGSPTSIDMLSSLARNIISAPEYNYQERLLPILRNSEFQKDDLAQTIISILKLDKESIHNNFERWKTNNCYDAPVIETFYMKHALIKCGEAGARALPDPGKPTISLSSLAYYGRFTHTLKNYLTTKIYAKRNGFQVETPEWPSHYFFDLADPFISQDKGKIYITDMDILYEFTNKEKEFQNPLDNSKDYDLLSPESPIFFQEYKQEIYEILKVRPLWEKAMGISLQHLRSRGKTLVSIHIRLGDMDLPANSKYGTINYNAYLDWLRDIWPGLENPVLFIASDEPDRAKKIFEDYAPLSLSDLPANLPVVSPFQDFYILMNSDVLVVSRGGFGSTAAALNKVSSQFFRQSPDGASIVPFSPWQ